MANLKFTGIYQSVHFRAILVICILASIFFAPFIVDGKAFLAADILHTHYPWKYYAPDDFLPHNKLLSDPVNVFYAENYNKGLKEGRLSQWNPYILGGMPGLMGGPGPYYPVKMILHILFSTYTAMTLFLFIHVLLMGFFMYYYLFEIDAGWRGALFGAIAYMFNGCAMVWLEFEAWVSIGAFLPLLLTFMERFLGGNRLRWAFAAGLTYGVMFLTANLQLAVYISILMLSYLAFILLRSYKLNQGGWGLASILTCFAITGIIGIMIGAVEILPFTELASNSSRINISFDFDQLFNTLARVPFRHFVTLFFPDYFGSPVLATNMSMIPKLPTQVYMNYCELTLYAGIATVFAFIACAIAEKNGFSWYYLFMTLLIIAMITGTYAYYPFFKLVPGMNKMNPTRLIFLFAFVFSVAAGLGLKGLENLSQRRSKVFLGTSLFILAAVGYLSISGASLEVARWFNKESFNSLSPAQLTFLIADIDFIRSLSSPVIYIPLLLTAIAFCLFSLFVLVRNKSIFNAVYLLILTLLSYDLITFGRNYNTTVDPKSIYPQTPSIAFLQKQTAPFRVVQDRDNGFLVNALVPFQLEEIGGYQSIYPDRFNKLMSYVQYGDNVFAGKTFDRWIMFGSKSTDLSSRMFDMLNVRYVLTSPDAEITNNKFKRVFREDAAIYENTTAMPRAYVVHQYAVLHDLPSLLRYMGSDNFDMRKQVVLEEAPSPEFISGMRSPHYPPAATIVKYSPDEIGISANLSSNGWLVLSDNYYPGWTAEVDGKKAMILRANSAFRAVALHAGKHHVSFTYRPFSVRASALITILGAILAILGISLSGKLISS